MTVQEMIEQMGERVFDQSFQDYLSATCDATWNGFSHGGEWP